MPTLAFALELLNSIPTVIAAGIDIVSFYKEHTATIEKAQEEGRDITREEREALDDEIDRLRSLRPDVSGE